MKPFLVASLLALGIVAMAAPLAGAGNATVTVSAKESGCAKTFCFDIAPTSIASGDTITVNFNNPSGNTQHSFCVFLNNAWKCAPDSGFANGGTSATMTFTAPAAGQLAYKCAVPGHDVLGMAGNITVTPAMSQTNNTTPPPTDNGGSAPTKSSPSIGLVAMVAGIGLLAVALRRR